MEEKELKAKDIPKGYPLCFNEECAEKGKCMHYQARLLMPDSRYFGSAVFPLAWKDGKCKCFKEKKLVNKAWGFTKIYDNVPQRQKAEARACVHSFFVEAMAHIIGFIMVRISFHQRSRKRF